ncbi:uncharacterized protein JCM10292_006541 [Rhodotorula paludigena]|uniref:uncharacterized protein n=1 Tax=Rhodotorula paludigena TaxID=86838 RepID=UPI003170BBA2
MPPGQPLVRFGCSLSGRSTSSAPTLSPWAAPSCSPSPRTADSPPLAPGSGFDRAKAFRERLAATRLKASDPAIASAATAAEPPPPGPPPALTKPLDAPTSTPAPIVQPAAVYNGPYPIGGPQSATRTPLPAPPGLQVPPSTASPPQSSQPTCTPQLQAPPPPSTNQQISSASLPPQPLAQPLHSPAQPHSLPTSPPLPPLGLYPYPPPPHHPLNFQPAYVFDPLNGTWVVQSVQPPECGAPWPCPVVPWMHGPPPLPYVPEEHRSDAQPAAVASTAGQAQADKGAAAEARIGGTASAEAATYSSAVAQQVQRTEKQTQRRDKSETPVNSGKDGSSSSVHRSGVSRATSLKGAEAGFGGLEKAREAWCELLGVTGLEGNELERRLEHVWREKILSQPVDAPSAATTAHLADTLRFLLLTHPQLLPSDSSSSTRITPLELALLDVTLRVIDDDMRRERDEVRKRWQVVCGKWKNEIEWRDQQGVLNAETESELTAAREHITSFDRQLRDMAEDLESQRVELAERDKEVKNWKVRAEKAEHKMREQPSRRVALLLQDLDAATQARNALSDKLDETNLALSRAQGELARLRPVPLFSPSSGPHDSLGADSAVDDKTAAPLHSLETELKRAKEAGEADRLIWEDKAQTARLEADKLREKLAEVSTKCAAAEARSKKLEEEAEEERQQKAKTPKENVYPSTSGTSEGAGSTSTKGDAASLRKAQAELAQSKFVINKLADKVKELNKDLADKATENADLLARLVDPFAPSASPSPSVA